MAIRFLLPRDAADAVTMTSSPLIELALSLRVLAAPYRHPLRHAWVRRMRRLDPALRRRIRAFGFAYRCGVPDTLFPSDGAPTRSFAEDLARVRSLDPAQIVSELEEVIRGHRSVRDHCPPALSGPALAELAASHVAADSPEEAEAIRLFGAVPERAIAELFVLMEDYWRESFSEEWRTIGPRLADANAELEARLRRDFYGSLNRLQHQLRADPRTGTVAVDIRVAGGMAASPEKKLVIVPSTFMSPGVMVKFHPPGSPGLIYPAPPSGRAAVDLSCDAQLVRIVRALADDTRLRALKILARDPGTTQELAPLLGITESGLSKHLRILANAGLVQSRRESYYVVYSVVPDRIASLSSDLLGFIEDDGAGFSFGESVAAAESG